MILFRLKRYIVIKQQKKTRIFKDLHTVLHTFINLKQIGIYYFISYFIYGPNSQNIYISASYKVHNYKGQFLIFSANARDYIIYIGLDAPYWYQFELVPNVSPNTDKYKITYKCGFSDQKSYQLVSPLSGTDNIFKSKASRYIYNKHYNCEIYKVFSKKLLKLEVLSRYHEIDENPRFDEPKNHYLTVHYNGNKISKYELQLIRGVRTCTMCDKTMLVTVNDVLQKTYYINCS